MNFLRDNLPEDLLSMVGVDKCSKDTQRNQILRDNLQVCTYPHDTKYKIEKASKQVFHVYPHFHSELIVFSEAGYQKVFIQLKGTLQIQVKGVPKKVNFCMMLLANYPQSAPQVRIVNTNGGPRVGQFYEALQSKTDPSSYLLNQKLAATKNWHPCNSLVNVILQSQDLLTNKFPFCDPISQKIVENNWQQSHMHKNSLSWGNISKSDCRSQNRVQWINNADKGQINVKESVNINAANINHVIVGARQLVTRQKGLLDKINNKYIGVVNSNQQLDATKHSLESEETYLSSQNFQMTNFLLFSQSQPNLNVVDLVQPKDERSEQIINLVSSVRARQDCLFLLEAQFNQQTLSLQDFLKQLRKIEQMRFEQKYLLSKCVEVSSS